MAHRYTLALREIGWPIYATSFVQVVARIDLFTSIFFVSLVMLHVSSVL